MTADCGGTRGRSLDAEGSVAAEQSEGPSEVPMGLLGVGEDPALIVFESPALSPVPECHRSVLFSRRRRPLLLENP